MMLIYADIRYGADPVLETLRLLLLLTGGIILGRGAYVPCVIQTGKKKGL